MFLRKTCLFSSVAAGSLLLSVLSAEARSTAAPAYLMADQSRTSNYEAALESWRTHLPFKADYAKAYLGLEHAYVRGLTGKGTTIAINDTGLYWDHPLFAGLTPDGLDTGASDAQGNRGAMSSTQPWMNHGTHVAGTAAGRLNGGLAFGAAYGAGLYAASTHFVGNNYEFAADYFGNGVIADGIDNLLAIADGQHARIINNSWGISQRSLAYDASQSAIDAYYDRARQQILSKDWDAILRNDALVVMSAGNDEGFHTSQWNMAPAYVSGLDGHFVTVTNYTAEDVANGSSLCGAAATWCVAGPGTDILSAIPDFSFDTAGWNRDHDYMDLIRDKTFFADYSGKGLVYAIDAYYQRKINAFISARDSALASGQGFDAQGQLAQMGQELSAFSQTLMALLITPKPNLGAEAEALVNALNARVGDGLSAHEAALISQAYRDDLIPELQKYMGEVTPAYAYATGTSMAAPAISGFAALLMEQFPDYATPLITDIMLSSGRDIEEAGVDIRSGWGVPQMEAALNGPSALRAVREVRVQAGSADVWTHDISDAIDRYSPLVLERNPDDRGGLIKLGGGELVLTGRNTYSDETRVREGLLTLEGRLTRSALTVEGLGMVRGTGQMADLIAASGGVVAPGNADTPFGTLHVTGNARFETGSWLWVRANTNASQYSRLEVEGAAQIEGGQVLVKADTGTWNLRRRGIEILTAGQGVTGQFDGVTSDLGFLTPSLTYQDRGVLLQLVRNDVAIASAGTTENARQAGAALDVMVAQNTSGDLSLEDAILDGSFEAVQAALPSLTGEVHPSLAGLVFVSAGQMREAVLDRGRTRPSGDQAYQANYGKGLSAWASGQFGRGEFSGNDQLGAFSHTSTGFAAGIDKRLSDHLLVGAAIGQSSLELEPEARSDSGKATTTQAGLYGASQLGRVGLRLGAMAMNSRFDTRRTVTLNAFSDTPRGDYDGTGWQVWAEASSAFQAGGTSIEPYLGYSRYGFSGEVVETGEDAALSGSIEHQSSLITAGLRTQTRLTKASSASDLKLVTHLAYSQALGDEGARFNARYADGPAFEVSGPKGMEGGLTTAIGLEIRTSPAVTVQFGYSGLHQSEFGDNRLYGRLSLSF